MCKNDPKFLPSVRIFEFTQQISAQLIFNRLTMITGRNRKISMPTNVHCRICSMLNTWTFDMRRIFFDFRRSNERMIEIFRRCWTKKKKTQFDLMKKSSYRSISKLMCTDFYVHRRDFSNFRSPSSNRRAICVFRFPSWRKERQFANFLVLPF